MRSATTDGASIEDRYEYDAFGTPYKGDFSAGLDGGYTGKPYDATTGLYNYGYREYNPQTARFTTVDPIRDGNNWFSYVVNDPVNYVVGDILNFLLPPFFQPYLSEVKFLPPKVLPLGIITGIINHQMPAVINGLEKIDAK